MGYFELSLDAALHLFLICFLMIFSCYFLRVLMLFLVNF